MPLFTGIGKDMPWSENEYERTNELTVREENSNMTQRKERWFRECDQRCATGLPAGVRLSTLIRFHWMSLSLFGLRR